MTNDLPMGERRFTVKDAHTNTVYGGIENVPSDHGNLMLAELAPGETRGWHNLAVGEHCNLKQNLIIVRVI